MKSIANILQEAVLQLKDFDSASIDAELLLAHVLQKNRAYLYAWPEKTLTPQVEQDFLKLIELRKKGQPIAYLLKEKEFWSLTLKVNEQVLIPRADTESLVEAVLELVQAKNALIADLGTGSGAIALALASEKPNWHIIATDYCQKALEVAKENAKTLGFSNIEFLQGNWCEALPNILLDAIVSNPPYIDQEDPHLKDLSFEPRSALVSDNHGLSDIEKIAKQAKSHLKPGGFLLIEHGYNQAKAVQDIFLQYGYQNLGNKKDLGSHVRLSFARK